MSCLAVLGSFTLGWCLMMWRIWSINNFKGRCSWWWRKYSPCGLGRDVPAHASTRYQLGGSQGIHAEWLLWSTSCLALKHRSIGAIGCWLASGELFTWVSLAPNSMTCCCTYRRIFICVNNWWLTCVTASRSRSAVSRWMTTNSHSQSAFARCSSNYQCRSITIWTSCPRLKSDGLNSSEALTSCLVAFLGAMVVLKKCIGWAEILNKDSEPHNESTKSCM